MTAGQRRFVAVLVTAVIAVLIGIGIRNYFKPDDKPVEQPPGRSTTTGLTAQTGPSTAPVQPDPPVRPDPPVPIPGVKITAAVRAAALTVLQRGLDLHKQGKLLKARSALADALASMALPTEQARIAREKLIELADRTLFNRRVVEKDPCTFLYTFKPREVLVRVERKLKLRVPTQLIQKINSIRNPSTIQIGQTLKMIRGPFHAVVYKSRFVMDVFLEEPKTHRMIFVRRFRIGIGKDGSTPAGRWRVAPGKKTPGASWIPPVSSNLPRESILPGDPRYPLGRKGYWIGLEGIGKTPYTKEDAYGIHGTKDPSSIGKASSMGCIRLADDDIEMLFFMLYEQWSKVTILP